MMIRVEAEPVFHPRIRYSDLHVSSLTAREGSIVLELNAVMLPSADPLAEQSSVETRPESQAALPIDPVVWLDLMQVHKMLSANTTVSILVGLWLRYKGVLHNMLDKSPH